MTSRDEEWNGEPRKCPTCGYREPMHSSYCFRSSEKTEHEHTWHYIEQVPLGEAIKKEKVWEMEAWGFKFICPDCEEIKIIEEKE